MKYEEARDLGEKIRENLDYSLENDILVGCQIFVKYGKREIQGAEHDIVYGPTFFEEISEEDATKLFEHSWFLDDDNECWACFV